MSGASQPGPESPSRSPSERLNDVCLRFEAAWKQGRRPCIEDELAGVPEPERSTLLRVLLALELEYRRLSHETLVREHYQQRFPESAGLVRAVFAAVVGTAAREAGQSAQSRPAADTDLGPAPPGPYGCPACLGRHRITARLGAGGFGVVYKAYDPELKRDVAIKVPHPHRTAAPQDAEAYLAEARILAGLDHPHIVPVYDVGRTEDGLCYVVSKFIEGSDLAQRLKQGRPSFADAVELVARVADALHHAHQRGLVHRDIKPGNI
jgi:hypothetical protein